MFLFNKIFHGIKLLHVWPHHSKIARVMSANMTHLTKILVVNCKQHSNNIIYPYFMVSMGQQCQGGATVAKVSKFECSKFCDIWKTDFGILIHCKNGTVTLWACTYPQDTLTTCCHHTCQGCGEGDQRGHSCVGSFTRYVGLGTGSTWWNLWWDFLKIYHHILIWA
jgi:hypothetical protein